MVGAPSEGQKMLGTLSLAEGPSHSSTTLFIGQQLIRHYYFNLIGRISDLLYFC